jgi:RHS repeat-associated protein
MPDAIGDLNRPDITTRGFTGREQLNNLSLAHMNGRVYNYNLGRFLSVDPVIQFPKDGQSINPCIYSMSNPKSGVGPSGYLPSTCGFRESSHCEGNANATVRGRVINGKVKVGTAFIP